MKNTNFLKQVEAWTQFLLLEEVNMPRRQWDKLEGSEEYDDMVVNLPEWMFSPNDPRYNGSMGALPNEATS